jgi:hypothetical protein
VNNLERRYRRLLRVLPRWYRAEREEEMVGIFLADRDDDLDQEYGWPGWGETGATLGLAVRTRFAADAAPAYVVRLGDVVRLVAMLGLLAQVAAVAEQSARAVIWRIDGLPAYDSPWAVAFEATALGAAAAMFAGHRSVAKTLTVALVLYGLVHLALTDGPAAWWVLGAQVPLWVTAAALFAGFHREAPAPPAAPWWRAAALAVPIGVGWAFLPIGGLIPFAVIVAGVVVLLRRGPAVWGLALAMWAAVHASTTHVETPLWQFQAAGLIVVTVLLAVLGLRLLTPASAPGSPRP